MPTVKIANEALSVAADTHGAELASIRTPDGAEWLWQGDAAWWKGRAPILFPIVGRNLNNIILIGGREYRMGTHGFARQSDFVIAEQKPASMRFRLTDTSATRAEYPFAFVLDVVFELDGGTLVNRAEITNAGDVPLSYSFGFHPAFQWPLPGGEGKQHWVTLAEREEPPTRRLGENLMLAHGYEPSVFKDGRYAPAPDDFKNDAVIIDSAKSRALTFGVDGGPSLETRFDDFPSFGLWQFPGAPYLCIEPWQGLTPFVGGSNAIEDRPGGLALEPGATRTFTMTMTPRPQA
jgi:galactose mutarotase-like enzyme